MPKSPEDHEQISLLDADQLNDLQTLQQKLKRFKLLLTILVISLLASNFAIATFFSQSNSPNLIPITFQPNSAFSDDSNPTTDAAWGSLMPPGDGFISKDGLHDISMYHQLHCLSRIRNYLWTMKFAIKNKNLEAMNHPMDHVGHCFDYLRQSILCAGDLTLEPATLKVGGVGALGVDGWGVEHMCVDPGVVERYLREHAVRT